MASSVGRARRRFRLRSRCNPSRSTRRATPSARRSFERMVVAGSTGIRSTTTVRLHSTLWSYLNTIAKTWQRNAMSESTDAKILLNEGDLITLKGGEQRHLSFDNEALLKIEERYGTFPDFFKSLGAVYLRNVAFVFSAAFRVTEKRALEMIDSRQLKDYLTAIGNGV